MRIALSLHKLHFSKVENLAEENEGFCYENTVAKMNILNSILFEKLCGRADLKRKTAHSLKLTCATRLYQNSVDKQSRERSGYASNASEMYVRNVAGNKYVK